jgi:hypothetical protein
MSGALTFPFLIGEFLRQDASLQHGLPSFVVGRALTVTPMNVLHKLDDM